MKKIFVFMLLLISLRIIVANEFGEVKDKKYLDLVKKEILIDDFEAYFSRRNPKQRLVKFNNENSENLFFIVSTDYSKHRGYQGTTTVGIVFNDSLKVIQANIIKSQETSSYIKRINSMGFMQRFKEYIPGQKVELISGATLTCESIQVSINESLEKVKPLILDFVNK
ncbi:MAG: FMN-binding protein [Candidatus Cloacimonetes bacterium]|nr:FMN-binding protein [Candidatus Cloacimonadota bacterium]